MLLSSSRKTMESETREKKLTRSEKSTGIEKISGTEHETHQITEEKKIVSTHSGESENWVMEREAAEAALEAKQMDFVKEKLQMVGHMSDFEMQLKNMVEEQWELQQQQQEATWVVEN
ncbi:unnamed protein product [Sphagnum balticum]